MISHPWLFPYHLFTVCIICNGEKKSQITKFSTYNLIDLVYLQMTHMKPKVKHVVNSTVMSRTQVYQKSPQALITQQYYFSLSKL